MKKYTKKQKKLFMRKVSLLGVILMTALFTVAVVSAVYFRVKYVNEKINYPFQVWQPGEIVMNRDIAFSLNAMRTDEIQIDGMWELPDEHQFVLVNISFKNMSEDTYHLSPIKTMKIKDINDNIYEVSSAPSIQDSLGGPVESGKTVRGEVGFILPKNITDATFVFSPTIHGSNDIHVAIEI